MQVRDKDEKELFLEDESESPIFQGAMKRVMSETYAKPYYALKRYLMFFLWVLHELIKERDFYLISDYLYWPNGLCWDMVVLIALGAVVFLCGWDDFSVCRKIWRFPTWKEIKDELDF